MRLWGSALARRLGVAAALMGVIAIGATTPVMAALPGVNGELLVYGTQGLEVLTPDGTVLRLVTLNPAGADAALSPDGTRIAYDSNDDLWVSDATGGAATDITNGGVRFAADPTWSPDGTRIAFSGMSATGYQIYTIRPNGLGLAQLTHFDNGGSAGGCSHPSWSSSSKIAYQVDSTTFEHIAVISPNGTGDTDLMAGTSASGAMPDWSPDGTRIAYETANGTTAGLATMNANGTNQSIIPNTATGTVVNPAWSPDGKQIAYRVYQTGDLRVINVDGSADHSIGQDGMGRPSWQAVKDRLDLSADPVSATLPATVAISGRLQLYQVTASGLPISLEATSPDGTKQPVVGVSTDASGGFSTEFAPGSAGTWTIEADWPGDATHPAVSGTTTVTLHLRAVELTLATSRAVITYGRSVTLTAHLSNTHTNRVVSVYSKPYNRSTRLLTAQRVNSKGLLSLSVRPRRNTVYSVAYAGDDYDQAAGATRPVGVKLIQVLTMKGFYATSHGYHLVHYSTSCARSGLNCPRFTVSTTPKIPGGTADFELDVLSRAGSWGYFQTASLELNRHSSASVILRYRRRTVETHRYRIGAECHGRAYTNWPARPFKVRITP
jgi:hypothetical protein